MLILIFHYNKTNVFSTVNPNEAIRIPNLTIDDHTHDTIDKTHPQNSPIDLY